jgi:glyoxylate carboligase
MRRIPHHLGSHEPTISASSATEVILERVTNVSMGTELDAASESDEITSLREHAPHRRLPILD